MTSSSRRNFFQSVSSLAAGGAAVAGLASVRTAAAQSPVGGSVLDPVSVKAFGALGDGHTDDTKAIQAAADFCFGPAAAPNAQNWYLNQVLYFPHGHYVITSPIIFTRVGGVRILGAGRFTTTVENVAGWSVFGTNGCGYAHFEGLCLKGWGNAAIFDLNYDGTPFCACLQSNTFHDMYFVGGGVGVQVGAGGHMGSENLFTNCFWEGCSVAGIRTMNPNALQQTVIGGNIQGCGNGIWCTGGSVPVIHGVGFQDQTGYDIRVEYSANDTYDISGCRSESTNFIYGSAGQEMMVSACSQMGPAPGDFVFSQSSRGITISACRSVTGRVVAAYDTRMLVQECSFGRADWMAFQNLWYKPNNNRSASVELENIGYGWATGGAWSEIARQRVVGDPTKSGAPHTYNYVVQ